MKCVRLLLLRVLSWWFKTASELLGTKRLICAIDLLAKTSHSIHCFISALWAPSLIIPGNSAIRCVRWIFIFCAAKQNNTNLEALRLDGKESLNYLPLYSNSLTEKSKHTLNRVFIGMQMCRGPSAPHRCGKQIQRSQPPIARQSPSSKTQGNQAASVSFC